MRGLPLEVLTVVEVPGVAEVKRVGLWDSVIQEWERRHENSIREAKRMEEEKRLVQEEENMSVEERYVRLLERELAMKETRMKHEIAFKAIELSVSEDRRRKEKKEWIASEGGWNSYMGMTHAEVKRRDEAERKKLDKEIEKSRKRREKEIRKQARNLEYEI